MAREVTIVGGGLAGLSLGIALRGRGVPVALHEAGSLPRHRVCGEFLCGVEPSTLRNLGVAEDLADAEVHRESRWSGPDGRPFHRQRLPRPALGLSRHALDLRLARRLERAGGRVFLGERWRGDPRAEGVVLASGRKAGRTPWMGFKVHLSGDLPGDLSLFLGDGGYVGLSPVEGGFWNLCGLFRKRPEVRAGKEGILGAYAEANGMTGVTGLLAKASLRPGSAAAVAGVSFAPGEGGHGEARIGDAWGVIPPFTGNGMSIAFESAEIALDPVSRWSSGGLPWEAAVRRIERAHRSRFRRRFRVANALHPWLFSPRRRGCLRLLARSGLLPFRPLFALTH